MTKTKAEELRLDFTGIYDWDKEKVKPLLEEIRKEYPTCKFYLVTVPSSPLSRCCIPSKGYSVYGDRKYSLLKYRKSLKSERAAFEGQLDYLKNEYDNKVAELTAIQKEREYKLAEVENELDIIYRTENTK